MTDEQTKFAFRDQPMPAKVGIVLFSVFLAAVGVAVLSIVVILLVKAIMWAVAL